MLPLFFNFQNTYIIIISALALPLPCILAPTLILNFLLCAVMAHHFRAVISPADAGHTQTKFIYAAVITVTLLATIAVILRFMARRKSEASISYEYVLSESILPFRI